MADAMLQIYRRIYCVNYLKIIRFRGSVLLNTLSLGNRRSIRRYGCASSFAVCKERKIFTKTRAPNVGQKNYENVGNVSMNSNSLLKVHNVQFFRSLSFKSGGNSDLHDDDDDDDADDDDDDDDDTKARSFKKSSTRRKPRSVDKNTKYSTQVQKSGNSLIRPSRYEFTDLNKEDEESRWVKRPSDTITTKSRVDWYAKQMVRLTSEHQVDKAQELFNSMRLKNIRPTTEIFNILIAGYGKIGKTRKAFHHYNNIKKMALQPTAHSYTSLFNICAQMPSLEQSSSHLIKLWEEFQGGVKNNNITCDIITYNAALKAAASCRSLSLAIEIYEEMCLNNLQPECRSYSSLLVACAGEGEVERVAWVLGEMKEHNVKPDLFVFNALLRAIRDSRSQNQFPKQNTKTFAKKIERTSPQSNNMITERSETMRNLESNSTLTMNEDVSLDHSNSMTEHLDLSSSKNTLTSPEIFTGVEDFLQLMAVNDVLPDIRTFHLLVQVAKLEVSEEKYVLDLMKDWDVKPDLPVLNALIRRRALFGDIERAQAYMKMFEEELGVKPSIATYQSLARGCRKSTDGLWLLKEMKDREFLPDISVYGKMIKNATHRQDFQFLTGLLKEMRKSQIQPTAEIIELLDEVANKPHNREVTKKSDKPFTREQKKSQFIRKQRFGFYGFYKTWKQQFEQDEQNKPPQKVNTIQEQIDSKPEEKQDKEDINYDHL